MRLISLILSLGTALSLVACSSWHITSTTTSNSTFGTTTTISTSITTSTSSSTTGAGNTFAQLAVKGEVSYNNICSKCHGSLFVGGTGHSTLAKYGDAARLLSQIRSMPSGLSQQGSWEVLCYLLVQDNFIPGDTIFNADTLSRIPLQ